MINPCQKAHIYGKSVSINWQTSMMQVDARTNDTQLVTTCILRPNDPGPREIFTGTVVASPSDGFVATVDQGKKLALARAIYQYINSDRFSGDWSSYWYSQQSAWNMARSIYYRIIACQPEEAPAEEPVKIEAMALAA